MKKSGLRYFIFPMWLINMVFIFGSVFTIFSNENGQLPLVILGIVGLIFVFFIYLTKDSLQFNRPLFLKIIATIFLISVPFYLYVKNILLVIPMLISGILLIKHLAGLNKEK